MKRLDYYIIAVLIMIGMFLSSAVLMGNIHVSGLGLEELGRRLEMIVPDQRYQFLKETEAGWLVLDSELGAICFIDARQSSNGSCKGINRSQE